MIGLKTEDGLYQAILKAAQFEKAHIVSQRCAQP